MSVKSGATEGRAATAIAASGRARRTSAMAGSAITASPSQLGANDHEAFHSGLIVSMKIALLQINPTVGDLAGNAQLIAGRRGAPRSAAGAELAVTPELALVGYLPRDLLLSPGFVSRCWDDAGGAGRGLAGGPAVLVGLPEPNPSDEGRPLFNSAVLLRDGASGQRFRKALLPTYDVFDEDRYFEPFHGPQMLDARRSPPRHQHLRRRLERPRLLEAPALSPRPDQELVDSWRPGDRQPLGIAVHGRQARTCATRCSAAWPRSTACRSCM